MENQEKKTGIGKKIVKFFIGAVAILLILLILLIGSSYALVHPTDDRTLTTIGGFYKEKEDSLDAVFIGSSTTYANWNPMLAWDNYGITSYSLASANQPLYAAWGLVKEIRKTQPNALIVINLVSLAEFFDEQQVNSFHFLLDYMPFSMNKIEMTKYMLDACDFDYFENIEYFLPVVRFHDRWPDLDEDDFNHKVDGVKSASHYSTYLTTISDVSEFFRTTDKVADLKKDHQKIYQCMADLLEYLKEEKINALFITYPTSYKTMTDLSCMNAAEKMVEEAGFPLLDFQTNEMVDEVGLDLTNDYYNYNHVNIHGSVKMTKYICDYLVENYGFKDKRNDKSFADLKSWQKANEKYKKMLAQGSLEQEYTYQIDYDFDAPVLHAEHLSGTEVSLSWDEVEGADGYVVYRKDSQNKNWKEIVDRGSGSGSFVDINCQKDVSYTYTVIAFRNEGSGRVWSRYNYRGKTVKL